MAATSLALLVGTTLDSVALAQDLPAEPGRSSSLNNENGLPQSATLPLPNGCYVAGSSSVISSGGASNEPAFPPVQLEVRTPFEPTPFRAGGYNYLIYELHLQNFTGGPLALRSVEVFDAAGLTDGPIASFAGSTLVENLVPIGADALDEDVSLRAGQSAVAFICLAFDSQSPLPEALRHRVMLADSIAVGPVIGARNGEARVLAPPVSGTDWVAVSGLNRGSHHRSGLFIAGGLAQISRRYAVDWKRTKDGAFFSGDARDVHSYHAYGQEVLAVADATVVTAKDGLPDNIPRTRAGFATAVPVTMETVAGNSVVLDLGGGQFAYYAHLKPGSVRVLVGDRVRRGQSLGLIGNSGDAREPHLHFQVTTNPEILASEGLPYVIDSFRVRADGVTPQGRINEFPLGGTDIEFEAE